MKTKWVLACVLLFMSIHLSAGNGKSEYFKYGIKTGFDMSPVSFTTSDMLNQYQDNLQVGLFIQGGKNIYLQPEVYFVGNSASPSLRIPVMLGWRFLNFYFVSFHLMGGPMWEGNFSNLTQGFATTNWQVGAGVDVLGFLTADIRYTLKNGPDIISQVTDFNTNTDMLNLTVGLKF